MDIQEFRIKLLDIINKNPDGFTIDFNLKPIIKNKGFFVSITNNFNKDFNNAIDSLLRLKQDFKQYEKNLLIGLWFDKPTKTYYLDLSIYIKTKSNALIIAKLFNQKAIFDIKNLNCLNVSN